MMSANPYGSIGLPGVREMRDALVPLIDFAAAPIVTPRALAYRHGIGAVWLPSQCDEDEGRWRYVRLGDPAVALAECAQGVVVVMSSGRRVIIDDEGALIDLDVADAPVRHWVHVRSGSGVLAFIDRDGRVEIIDQRDRFVRAELARAENVAEIACGTSCIVTRGHQGRVQCWPNPLRITSSPYDLVIERVIAEITHARSLAADGETVAIVDASGAPHVAGPGASLIARGMPIAPLAAIAMAPSGYAAALTEAGELELLGAWRGARLGSALSEIAWCTLECGVGWVAVRDTGEATMAVGDSVVRPWLGDEHQWTDQDGRSHSFGFAMNGLRSLAMVDVGIRGAG